VPSFAKHTYGHPSGPIRRTSSVGLNKASWLFQGSTGPPGEKLKNPVNSQSPPGEWASGSAPPGFYYQTRGDPPGGWTNSDPPGTLEPERSGRAPPGPLMVTTYGSLSGPNHFRENSLIESSLSFGSTGPPGSSGTPCPCDKTIHFSANANNP
jgi:hypothetical protein